MISDEDFSLLPSQDREALVDLVTQLGAELRRRKNKEVVTLPKLPANGRYVIKDATGRVRAVCSEMKVAIAQVESMAILLSLFGEATIYFYLNNCSQIVSVWRNGKRVADATI